MATQDTSAPRVRVEISLRRLVLAGGFALAVAAAPAVAAITTPVAGPASHVAACPSGEEEDTFTGACIPHTVPNSPSFTTPLGNPDIPEVNGVPCTGRNSGECIGLEEDAPQYVPPSSSVGSDPTIHGVA
jgi:hypothetical protein